MLVEPSDEGFGSSARAIAAPRPAATFFRASPFIRTVTPDAANVTWTVPQGQRVTLTAGFDASSTWGPQAFWDIGLRLAGFGVARVGEVIARGVSSLPDLLWEGPE